MDEICHTCCFGMFLPYSDHTFAWGGHLMDCVLGLDGWSSNSHAWETSEYTLMRRQFPHVNTYFSRKRSMKIMRFSSPNIWGGKILWPQWTNGFHQIASISGCPLIRRIKSKEIQTQKFGCCCLVLNSICRECWVLFRKLIFLLWVTWVRQDVYFLEASLKSVTHQQHPSPTQNSQVENQYKTGGSNYLEDSQHFW